MSSETSNVKHTRFETKLEIGRGGMGEIWLARDPQLQRDLAIKVLAASRANDSAFVDRFIEEAQITAQLQHPNIVPVHDIGRLEDNRPFFSMRLIKGETLDDLLRNRQSLDESQDRWLGIFQQVCQAIAYAHSKGVIHRDLKPSNIMVGRFGEVQVMDWGLAKILEKSHHTKKNTLHSSSGDKTSLLNESASDKQQSTLAPSNSSDSTVNDANTFDKEHTIELTHSGSIVQSIRYSPDEPLDLENPSIAVERTDLGSLTSQGYVLGTLAFMPPEQAQGKYSELDCCSDVFSLGAILCVILTGNPPYCSVSKADRLRMACAGELNECLKRLYESPYDKVLVDLAIECMAVERTQRPANASVVAERISNYLAETRERLRQAELDRAATEAKLQAAIETQRVEKQRRKWVRIAGFATAVCVVIGSLAFTWVRKQQSEIQSTSLQRDQERTRRLDQTRKSFEQSIAPVQFILDRLDRSEQIPSLADLSQLESGLSRAKVTYEQADTEIQDTLLLQPIIDRIEQTKRLVDQISSLPDSIDFEWLRQASPLNANTQPNEPIPVWAQQEWANALAYSHYQLGILPNDCAEPWCQTDREKRCWSAVGQQDWEQLIQLARDPEMERQSLAFQRTMAQVMLNANSADATQQALNSIEWVLCNPILAVGTQEETEVSESDIITYSTSNEGWIEIQGASKPRYKISLSLPKEAVSLIRIETYCGPPPDRSSAIDPAFIPTAPKLELIEENQSNKGPGRFGSELGTCIVREIRISRAVDSGEVKSMKVIRAVSEHTTVPGCEVFNAIDNSEATFWSFAHPKNKMFASLVLETEPLSAKQFLNEMHLEITSSLDTLWRSTHLGSFRIYYAKDKKLPAESLFPAAQSLLQRLTQQYPTDGRVLSVQARSKVASSRVLERNNEAATMLASTAASIAPFDLSILELFTEMTLAMRPKTADRWYQQLINHLDSHPNSSASLHVKRKIAEYQRDRGDRNFDYLPDEAFEAYQEAERLAPDAFHRYGRLAWGLTRKSRSQEAFEFARKGVSVASPKPEDLFYFGTIATRIPDASSEAFMLFEKLMQSESFQSEARLCMLHTQLAFKAGATDRGIELLNKHHLKFAAQPDVFIAAAIDLYRAGQKSELEALLPLWQSIDSEELIQSKSTIIVRDRRRTWGVLAMAVIEVDCQSTLLKVLSTQIDRMPTVVDDCLVAADQMLLERMPPLAPFVKRENTRKLIQVLQALQPEQPRWKIREALFLGIDGDWAAAQKILADLPFDLASSGDEFLAKDSTRSWQAFARVVSAVNRIEFNELTQDQTDAEIQSAQKALGRVPLADRDLAEWLWWEYRLKAR